MCIDKDKIIDYLDKQIWEHKVYECMPENEIGYEYVPRESVSKIVDELIPMIKKELEDTSKSETIRSYFKWHKEKGFVSHKDCDIDEFINEYRK